MIINKYKIKIPDSITALYCDKRELILIKGVNGKSILNLKLKLKILENNIIYVTEHKFKSLSNNEKKTIKSLRVTTKALINQLIYQVSHKFFKKLSLVGTGYKGLNEIRDHLKLINFKLGYSHNLFFKIPNDINIICYKSNNIYIIGNDYRKITQIASIIRKYKVPEPYKGKGILYQNEKIILKQGKKI